MQQLAQQEEAMGKQCKTLETKMEKSAQHLQEEKVKVGELQEKNRALERDMKRWNTSQEQLSSAVEAMKKANDGVQRTIEDLRKEIVDLKSTVADQQKLLAELPSLRTTIDVLMCRNGAESSASQGTTSSSPSKQ